MKRLILFLPLLLFTGCGDTNIIVQEPPREEWSFSFPSQQTSTLINATCRYGYKVIFQ